MWGKLKGGDSKGNRQYLPSPSVFCCDLGCQIPQAKEEHWKFQVFHNQNLEVELLRPRYNISTPPRNICLKACGACQHAASMGWWRRVALSPIGTGRCDGGKGDAPRLDFSAALETGLLSRLQPALRGDSVVNAPLFIPGPKNPSPL